MVRQKDLRGRRFESGTPHDRQALQGRGFEYLLVGPHKNRCGWGQTYVGKVKLDTPESITHLGELTPGVEWLTAVVRHVTFKRNFGVVLIVDRNKAKP